jgi:hypothetical protein
MLLVVHLLTKSLGSGEDVAGIGDCAVIHDRNPRSGKAIMMD